MIRPYLAEALCKLYPDRSFSVDANGGVTWQGEPPEVDEAAVQALEAQLEAERNKAKAIAELKQQRDAEIAEGVLFNGHRYPADAMFRDALMGSLLAWEIGDLAPDEQVLIRRMDDTNVLMSRAEVTALAAAVRAHVQGAYARYWTAKDALEA